MTLLRLLSRWTGLSLVTLWYAAAHGATPRPDVTAATNLVAWCIVPFDTRKRGPEERAAMLERLGLSQLAYDWRAEHIPTFDAEVGALQRHGVRLRAWWFPNTLNAEAQAILACIRRHQLHPELWVMSGEPPSQDQTAKVAAAAEALLPVVKAAAELGCRVGLYNHGGWFGEPENQLAIRARLAVLGYTNVGLIYNFHHGHDHLDRLPALFPQMVPHLLAVNLNGMLRDGERRGQKIVPFGTGEYDLAILSLIRESGYHGPIGILGHTEEDAEVKLKKDLAGLQTVKARLAAGESATWPPPGPPRPATSPTAVSLSGPERSSAGTPRVSGQEPAAQKEQDWVDNRWAQMDVGPAFASNLHLPDGSVIAKALTVQLPGPGQHCVAYDLATGVLRAAWSGGFLKFDAARFGLMGGQKPATPPWFVSGAKTGFPGHSYRFVALHMAAPRVLLEYEVDGVRVEETLAVSGTGTATRLVRQLAIAPTTQPLTISVAQLGDEAPEGGTSSRIQWLAWPGGSGGRAAAVDTATASLRRQRDGPVNLEIPAGTARRFVGLALFASNQRPLVKSGELTLDPRSLLPSVAALDRTTPLRLTTRGQRGADTETLAVDTLTLPYDNPARALFFGSGVDLLPDGTAFLSTMHGDVWRVTGIDDSLRELKWTRFATGLFQPLGLKVREGRVYVLGRDRITRLVDEDGDGVADRYENFHDGIQTSTGGHDYVTCLEQDNSGNFYYIDPLGMHRVSADGRSASLVAAGFRNPNGMGVSPDGRVLTAAPQQGTWTPSSGIWETSPARPDLWGGYPEPKIAANRPLGYDAPLCWIPHGVDNSSGSQVWVPPGEWGPLGGQMLHLLWGRCGMMLALRDTQDGRRNGITVPLPGKFLSGPNRGSFHSHDLYVAGSTGWQTSAVRDGCLQRVRWTGKRFLAPVGWEARRTGIHITFAEPLREDTARDPGSYAVKRWNYRYAQEYGSKDWSVKNPTQEGRDDVAVVAVQLSADRRTVSLQLDPWGTVMQFELKYNLDSSDGKAVKGSLWGTINGAGELRD